MNKKHVSSRLALALASLLVACGSTDGRAAGASAASGSAGDAGGPGTKVAAAPCSMHTGYLGDDMCIPPPDPAEGIQIHVGPSSYDDPAALAPFLLAPGGEDVRCYLGKIRESGFHYLRQQNRMRPSSHHMLINLRNGDGPTEGPSTACELSSPVGTIPGSQTPSRDFPSDLGPEDAGLARWLPPATTASVQLHYVNLTDKPVLREAWINLYRKDDKEITQRLQDVFLVGDLNAYIPPKSRETTSLEYTLPASFPASTRVFGLAGHMHAHTESLTAWRIRGGQRERVYRAFDWAEPLDLTFNSVVRNALPDDAARTDGGFSGLLTIEPGDTLRWSCDVNNDTDTALRFADEAHTAEMCMLVGNYISDTPNLLNAYCSTEPFAPGAAGHCSLR
jgi:hypothetical protein